MIRISPWYRTFIFALVCSRTTEADAGQAAPFRGPEDGDEELDLEDLAGGRVDELRLLARVIDEELVAGAVDLAHGQAPALEPAAVEVAEPRVAITVGMPLQALEVEQLQGDARPAALGVDPGAVGRRALPLAGDLRPAVQPLRLAVPIRSSARVRIGVPLRPARSQPRACVIW